MDKKIIAAIVLAVIIAGGAVFYTAKAYSGNWMMGNQNNFRLNGKSGGCGGGNCPMVKAGGGQCGGFKDANGNGVCDCRE